MIRAQDYLPLSWVDGSPISSTQTGESGTILTNYSGHLVINPCIMYSEAECTPFISIIVGHSRKRVSPFKDLNFRTNGSKASVASKHNVETLSTKE